MWYAFSYETVFKGGKNHRQKHAAFRVALHQAIA